jgi:hypothetical protein
MDQLQAQVATQQAKINAQQALIKETNRRQAKRVPINPNKVFRDIDDITAALEQEARKTAAAVAQRNKGKGRSISTQNQEGQAATSSQSLQLVPMEAMMHTFSMYDRFDESINADNDD